LSIPGLLNLPPGPETSFGCADRPVQSRRSEGQTLALPTAAADQRAGGAIQQAGTVAR
jgi:hypothetical protein